VLQIALLFTLLLGSRQESQAAESEKTFTKGPYSSYRSS